jgi:hypothetical protein
LPPTKESSVLNPFDFIRRRVAQTIVDGCADGPEAIDGNGTVPPATLERLQQRLALPAPSAPTAGQPAASRNSKRNAQ